MPRLLADLQLLRDEPAEGMADDGGLRLELADRVDVVIRDLPDPLVGEDLWILLSRLDGVRVIRPARRESRAALLFEQLAAVLHVQPGRASGRNWVSGNGPPARVV